MDESRQSSENLKHIEAELNDDQISRSRIEEDYTTPLKTDNVIQVVPSLPLNSKYERQMSDSLKTGEETESNEAINANSNNYCSPPTDSLTSTESVDSEHISAATDTSDELKELVTKSNVEAFYKELCELEQLFMNKLSLEWFYFIFEGSEVKKIKELFTDIDSKLEKETNVVCPERNNIWKWAEDVGSPDAVKVVIIGQDPSVQYSRWDEKKLKYFPMSSGTAFEVSSEYWEKEKKLKNGLSIKYIMKFAAPLTADSDSFNGNLRSWTDQGVLLINSCLTTAARRDENKIDGGQHWDYNWEFVTQLVVEKLGSAAREPTVMMPWGVPAKKLIKKAQIDSKHKVLEACHPVWQTYFLEDPQTNCSCERYCWLLHQGSEAVPRNDFKAVNEFLEQQGRGGIIWDCFGKKEQLRIKSTEYRENIEKCNRENDLKVANKKMLHTSVGDNGEEDGEKENMNDANHEHLKRRFDKNSEDHDIREMKILKATE